MIKFTDKDLLDVKLGTKQILAIYAKGQKLWPDILMSCYANGYWIDEYSWTDNTPWTV